MGMKKTATQVLEDQIMERATKEIADQIDFDVLASLLSECGWTKVELPRFSDRFHAIDIDIWTQKYITHQVKNLGSTFVFENPKDASHFILKWA